MRQSTRHGFATGGPISKDAVPVIHGPETIIPSRVRVVYVAQIEFDIWTESGLTRDDVWEAFIEALPGVVESKTERGIEGATFIEARELS